MKMYRILGKEDAIVDSASRFEVIYLFGNIGAPAAADMKTKDGTSCADASCARAIARCHNISTIQ